MTPLEKLRKSFSGKKIYTEYEMILLMSIHNKEKEINPLNSNILLLPTMFRRYDFMTFL